MAKVDHANTEASRLQTVDSPVGRLTLVATDDGLAAILWENDRPRRVRLNIDGGGQTDIRCSSRPSASSRSISPDGGNSSR